MTIISSHSSKSSLSIDPLEIDSHLRLHVKHVVILRLSAKIHLTIYLAINILLFAINQMSDPSYQWWVWAATGWGIPLAIHIFFVMTQKHVSGFQWHLFIYILINCYLGFIDLYTDYALTWVWYPLFGWAAFLIGHAVIVHDITKSTEEVSIFAVLISDDSGKTLICTEQKPEFLKDVLHMNDANIELIPMFLNAILQFSKEINMIDCNDFRLANKDMKVVSYAQGELVCTGFISVKSNSNTAREIFRRILVSFEQKFPKEIESFKIAGISTPFENYKIEMQQMIQAPFFKEAKMIDAN